MVRFALFVALLCAVTIYAWRRGGWPEKASASALAAQVVIDQAYHLLIGTRGGDFTDVHMWHFMLDIVLFAAVLFIALRADRFWPLWLGGTMIIMLSAHALRGMAEMHPDIYAVINRYPFWMAILVVGVGTALQDQRARKAAIEPNS
ncbi:hypothetical protein [Erythrobacter sp.]|uniref:hypothetical protein n=1 Tax=Erythrobacter sp. TaxID=1042 RepID=UPI001AFF33B2|nr:hypothetical protein [Erythrobacter sp.]MBO6526414.1 hypothetical protein [Erythrobacter sp.]MBO6530315.1 hypothetical protein [Erythrobacter sp.]